MARTSPPAVPTMSASIDHAAASRTVLPPAAIVPDERNRRIVEDDDFELLCDSIRVSGVLQPLQVWRRADGTHRLIDGERRWRAAQKLGLTELPCEVWPSDSDPRRVAVAGLALNEHRKAHGCLQIARRLRDLKNESGLTLAELAAQTGLPLDRVKSYFSLFGASDEVMRFIDEKETPLRVAVEIVRYERATNEARARRLIERYTESPLTVKEIVALRKREEQRNEDTPPARPTRALRIIERFEAEVRKDPSNVKQLEELARRLGYRLVPIAAQVQA